MNVIKEHWITFLFMTFVLLVAIISICFGTNIVQITDFKNIITEQIIFIYGISLNNIFTIFSIFTVIFGGIWAIYQYYKSINYKQQEKSSVSANKFSKELVARISAIQEVINSYPKKEDLCIVLEKIAKTGYLSFNDFEMKDLLKENDIKIYKDFMKYEKLDEILVKTLEDYPDFKGRDKSFELFLVDTLNSLEAWCIDIGCNASGSKFIYSSLHAIFFSFVQQVYILIASRNVSNIDLYFSNIIIVYNKWMKLRLRDQIEYTKTKLKIRKLENRTKKEMQKLLTSKKYEV